jgi:hypothetical protein
MYRCPCTHADMHACTHACIHTHTFTSTPARALTCTYVHTEACKCCTRRLTCTHHSGFSTGFNVSESVNFANEGWIPYGIKSLQAYRSLHRESVIATPLPCTPIHSFFFWGVYTHTHTHVHSLKRGQRYCVLHRDAVIGYMYMSLSCIDIPMQLCVRAHGRLRTRARTHIRTRARVHLKIDA